jgi:hypothetical protein
LWAVERRLYVDNLKVLLIAGIIAAHAVLGYAGFISVWSYTEMREVTLSPVTETALFAVIGPFGFLLIPLLFLVSGLLTPPSLDRKGLARFSRDRLLRLGVPFVLYVLLVQPAVMYAVGHPLGVAAGSYWYEFLGSDGQIDTGPLWFVGVLLIFSLAYAGWVAVRRSQTAPRAPVRITAQRVTLVAVAGAAASFLLRLLYPYGGESLADLNLWEWPACIVMFALGITASRQGWTEAVPERLRRECRTVTLLAVVAMAAFLITIGALDQIDEAMGGWHWPAAVFAAVEVTLGVFGSVWLLGVAQQHLTQSHRWAGPAVSRSAYAAFMLQTPILIALAVAARPLPLPAEVKALLVATGGILSCFALAWLLISRVPVIARIL